MVIRLQLPSGAKLVAPNVSKLDKIKKDAESVEAIAKAVKRVQRKVETR